MIIERITSLPNDLPDLIAEAKAEGFRFLDRLNADFNSGANKFDAANEALFIIILNDACVGIGGVNQDPINNTAQVGRLRRVYVSASLRGQGAGKQLIQNIEQWCVGKFDELQLFTDSAAAGGFYESIGYEKQNTPKVSHRKILDSSNP